MEEKALSFELDFLKKNKYCFVDLENYRDSINYFFDIVDKTWDDPPKIINRLSKEGYTKYDGPSLYNVLYASEFDDNYVKKMRDFLIELGIRNKLKDLLSSNVGVCNIRAYRFTHDPPKEKTHYLDNLDQNHSFNPHTDGLLPGSLKFMMFRNPLGEELTLDNGCLEIKPRSRWIPITGKSAIGVIFPPNIVEHRALRPQPNMVRDAIEVTIIKRIPDDFLVESSGAHAGYPKNLDLWNKKLDTLL